MMTKKEIINELANYCVRNGYISKTYKQVFKKNSFDKGISKLCYDLFEILYLTVNKNDNLDKK